MVTKHQSMPGRRKAVTQSSTTARRSRTAEAIRKQLKALQQEHQHLRDTAEQSRVEQAALQAQLQQLLVVTHASTQMNRQMTVEVLQVKQLWQRLQAHRLHQWTIQQQSQSTSADSTQLGLSSCILSASDDQADSICSEPKCW